MARALTAKGSGVAGLAAIEEIEAIKQLKARYFRTLDTRDWDGFAGVFTADALLDVRDDVPSDAGLVSGRDAIVDGIRRALDRARTVHHGHMPEIELTGPESARGVWAMFDLVEYETGGGSARAGFRGYGHYHETYRKQDGEWRIESTRLVRLRKDALA